MKNLKHLFLLLLLSFATLQAQTRSEIQTQIETIASGTPNTALKIRKVMGILGDGVAQTGDVKEIDVSTSYIAANFDPTGLGINERLGWAICNGNNGTRNRSGRVAMQYSTTYPTLGATGGSADAVVILHTHGLASRAWSTNNTDGLTTSDVVAGRNQTRTGYSIDGTSGDPFVQEVGESGVGKNMQPYIVTLMIMKL